MKWFYDLKIGIKLITSFTIVALIAGAIGILGVVNINKINNLDTELYKKMTVPLGEMVTITESYKTIRTSVLEVIMADNNSQAIEIEKEINENSDLFDKSLNSFSQTILTEEGKQLVSNLQNSKRKYMDDVKQIITLVNAGKHQDAIAILHGSNKITTDEIEDSLAKIVDAKLSLAKEASDNNGAIAKKSTITTTILLIAGMTIAVSLGIFISLLISRPIKKLMGIADKIADGNLNVNVDIDSKEEIGSLAYAFRRMINNVNEVMSNINNAAEQVASGAKQVSNSSVELSQGATDQASSIEELTASIEEISAQTKQNAQNANEANELAEIAKENAIEGNNQMKEMLRAMEEINESSSNISKIIKVIDEIAFQTNILALNAAVEAARAGQHGKGFAVVAEEVRNLAARSANAAKETTAMIEGSIKKVDGGTKIATETAEALNEIVDGIAKVADIISNISTASNEQATGISQINQGIMQVSEVVQTNSATSEESAAASEELSSQAELLRKQALKFKLKRTSSSSYNVMNGLSSDTFNMENREIYNQDFQNEDYEESTFTRNTNKQKKIFISDKEFGKY